MIRIAIVEDDFNQAEMLRNELKNYFLNKNEKIVISHFENGETFLLNIEDGFELVFMDIELPGQSGLEIARQMRKRDESCVLLFVTRMGQYAIHGYEVNACSYILKPVTSYAIEINLQRALLQIQRHREERVVLNTKTGVKTYLTKEVDYIEVMGHYLLYHTIDGVAEVYGNLTEVETRLQGMNFARCARSYLVNLARIRSVQGNTVRLITNEEISVSRSMKKQFMDCYMDYLGR